MSRVPLARLSSLRASQRTGFVRRSVPVPVPEHGRSWRRPVPTWVVREAERLRALWLEDLAMAAAEGLPVRG